MKLFISYAPKDEAFCDELNTHLALLKRQGVIDTWDARDITAGIDRPKAIENNLNTANIILLLISPDYIASDYCYDTELSQVLDRHRNGEARVIPIILRPCDWKPAPFGKFAALPIAPSEGVKSITQWGNRDEAFLAIAQGIRKVVEELNSVPTTSRFDVQKRDRIAEVRSRCCQKILYQYSTIQLLNGTEIGVDQLYVDVWVLNRPPHTFQVSQSKLLESFDLRNDRLGLGTQIERNEGIKVANDESKLLILGKPGSGKTTFLKHLAVDCINGKFRPELIPVLIELRRIRSAEWQLLNAISEELKLENQQTRRLLDEGKLLILMDGLDEVPTNQLRQNIQNQVQAFSQRFGIEKRRLKYLFRRLDKLRKEGHKLPENDQKKLDKILKKESYLTLQEDSKVKDDDRENRSTLQEFQEIINDAYVLCSRPYNRFIVTCRTQIEVTLQEFEAVEVADFNEEQVEKFVKNWLRASRYVEIDIEKKWQLFASSVHNNSALKELTATPVLLGLMCLVFQDAGELPSQIALLYRKGIRLLLEKWNDRKEKEIPDWKVSEWEVGKQVYRQLSIDRKEALLIKLAAWKFENPTNFLLFEQVDLVKQISEFLNLSNTQEGEAVLRAIETQHGLLVERADELWSFSHLSFQEYFTAQWLNQVDQHEDLVEKITEKRWQEVVKLAIKSQQPADRLLRLIKQAVDYSVSRDAKLQSFLTWVQAKAESVNALYKPAKTRAFYFALALNLNLDLDSEHNSPLILDHDLECNRILALTLKHTIENTCTLEHSLVRNLAHNLKHNRVRNAAIVIKRKRDRNRIRDLALNDNYINAFNPIIVRARKHDQILANKLQQLKAQLPTGFSVQNWEDFQRWWKSKGQTWTKELCQVMIEHRNIGHDWQFTEAQKQVLQRYHDANKFFVVLLKEPGAVSDTVRQEIEDNLLLPIATLRERLPEMYGEL